MTVNYDYYRCFYYVAKYRNLTMAASAMMTSQPNVTRVMQNLEQALGCQLCVRSNRGIVLTDEGEQLFRYVSVAFEQLRLGEEAVTRGAALQGGTVSIGASATAMHALLLKVLCRFHRDHPAVQLRIRNDSTPGAVKALWDGEIDFAVVAAPLELRPPLRQEELMSFQDILVGGGPFRDLEGKKLSLRDLETQPMIGLARGTGTFAFYSKFHMEQGLEWDPDIEVATMDLILPMVKNGLGLGFLPEAFAREALESGDVVRLKLEESIPRRHICLVQDSRRGLGAASKALLSTLRDCL